MRDDIELSCWWCGVGIMTLADGFSAVGFSLEFTADEWCVEFSVTLFKYLFWVSVGTTSDTDDEE